MNKVRTRFAPSPTGFMHLGGVRTALFAWLVARQSNGQFILRIEDTDINREVKGSLEHIIKTLRTLGLNYNEGPDIKGDFGPYKQSERLAIYKEWGEKLISLGRAYADPYTIEEVDKFRDQAKKAKRPFLYRDFRPDNPPKWDGRQPLRFLSEPKSYNWHDEIMGDLSASSEAVDDFILIKSDGYPTYNFAHIVDDHLMEITHIIRGQEFLASIPRFLNLYEALGLKHPILATVPYVLGPDGKHKLSKRDGAKDVLDYVNQGYLVEALINFMASLGWNDGTEQEIFSVVELIEKFKLKNVQSSGAQFDDRRLTWMNGAHIRQLDLDDLYKRAGNYWPENVKGHPKEYIKKVLAIVQERLKYLDELSMLTSFFFDEPKLNPDLIDNDRKLKDIDKKTLAHWLKTTKDSLSGSSFTLEDITNRLNQLLIDTNQKPAVLFSLIRIAITQSEASPGLFETIEILGKDKVLERINRQVESF